MKNTFIVIIILVILVVLGSLVINKFEDKAMTDIKNFDDCIAADYEVMESYPRQCRAPDGRLFTEDLGNALEKTDFIRLERPQPGDIISSPLEIRGEARGFWYFEADFPVTLLDGNGNQVLLNPSYITADDDWMTEDFVPFSSTHDFQVPNTEKGTLILYKDNPSGLPEHDDNLSLPIKFR